MKGISVSVYRNNLGDCTNGGVTSPHNASRVFILFDEAIERGNYDYDKCKDDRRFVCLKVVRRWVGTANEYLHVEAMLSRPSDCAGPMFGGNYVVTSDSRFRAVSNYPLAVHDRFETQEQYGLLSS